MGDDEREPLRVLVFSASLRAESLNTRLARLAATVIQRLGASVDLASSEPCNGRHGLLLSASPSMVGGNRGLWALCVPLEHLGARVCPDMFSLARAHDAFTENGVLADDQLRGRFDETVTAFLDLVEASTHYRCVRRAWVEFLGEHPDPRIDRVDA